MVEYLKPIDVKRAARVPYSAVIRWLTVGHPRAGILPSIDFAETAKRHSYRIRLEDWHDFQKKLMTKPRERRSADPPPRPRQRKSGRTGMFRY